MREETAQHPLMLGEPSHNSREAREQLVELLFEKFDAPGESGAGTRPLDAWQRERRLLVAAAAVPFTVTRSSNATPPAAVFLAKNAVLSSFASGRQTSLVVDAGHEATVGECHRCCCCRPSLWGGEHQAIWHQASVGESWLGIGSGAAAAAETSDSGSRRSPRPRFAVASSRNRG